MTPRAPAREIFGWAMVDFANSSYTTVIVAVVFSVVFPRLVVGDGPDFKLGNLLWSLALSASCGLVVLTAPVLGALMDFRAAKKKFLFASYLLSPGTPGASATWAAATHAGNEVVRPEPFAEVELELAAPWAETAAEPAATPSTPGSSAR